MDGFFGLPGFLKRGSRTGLGPFLDTDSGISFDSSSSEKVMSAKISVAFRFLGFVPFLGTELAKTSIDSTDSI